MRRTASDSRSVVQRADEDTQLRRAIIHPHNLTAVHYLDVRRRRWREREHRVEKEEMLAEVNRLAMWFSKPVEYSFIWPLRGGSYLSVRIYYDVTVRYACAASGDWASNV